jgi:hypothetical protein
MKPRGSYVRNLQEIKEAEHLPGIVTNHVDQDGEQLQVKRALKKVKLI